MFFSWGRFGCHLFWGQIPMGVEPSIARDDDSRLNGYPMLFFMIINKLLVNPEKTHIRWLNDILRIYIYYIYMCIYIYVSLLSLYLIPWIYPHIISHSIHIVIPLQRLNPSHIQVIKHALLENIPVSLDGFPPFSHLVRGLPS